MPPPPPPILYSSTGPVVPICWMSYCKPDKSLIAFELWGGVQNSSRWHRTIQFKCQNSARLVICHLSKATCKQTKCLTLFMLRILWTVYHVFPPPPPRHRAAAAAADAACVWSLGHRWSTVFLIILYTPIFLLEIRVIIKLSSHPWYPLICDEFK